MENQTLKWRAGAIGVSAIMTFVALIAMISQELTATVMTATMSIGGTTTMSAPAPTPQTTVAVPTMKATKPKGF
jgi:hypothetical protein